MPIDIHTKAQWNDELTGEHTKAEIMDIWGISEEEYDKLINGKARTISFLTDGIYSYSGKSRIGGFCFVGGIRYADERTIIDNLIRIIPNDTGATIILDE